MRACGKNASNLTLVDLRTDAERIPHSKSIDELRAVAQDNFGSLAHQLVQAHDEMLIDS